MRVVRWHVKFEPGNLGVGLFWGRCSSSDGRRVKKSIALPSGDVVDCIAPAESLHVYFAPIPFFEAHIEIEGRQKNAAV